MPHKEFNLKDPEIIDLAQHLGIDENLIETTNIRKRLQFLFEYYLEHHQEGESLLSFTRDLLSKIGYKAGFHPLDILYSYILTYRLLGQEPKIEESC